MWTHMYFDQVICGCDEVVNTGLLLDLTTDGAPALPVSMSIGNIYDPILSANDVISHGPNSRMRTRVSYRELARALHLSPECDIRSIVNNQERNIVDVFFSHPHHFTTPEYSESPRMEIDLNGGGWDWMVDQSHIQLHNFILQPEIQAMWEDYRNTGDSNDNN